ncbi:MAG: glycosyltransferase family 2 protein [Lachnospiraceae bacterium]|nr:glycosyltransferase family 2 protein [Lachnospiraceae bacterium]
MEKKNILYIVIPCYNEEAVIRETAKRVAIKMQQLYDKELISEKSRVLFVDDGSKDMTWPMIEALHAENSIYCGLKLSRNKGHQNALVAGLSVAVKHADMIISMDADLQDDIGAVDGFVEKYYEGCEIVYGVRSAREKDTFFKKFTAQSFYKLMQAMGVDIVYNHADYRLMSKRAVEELLKFKEVNLFLRGIVPLVGFKSDSVYYERAERFAGESKYPLKKMLAFAMDGITSFSIKPIRLITALGFFIFVVSLGMLLYSLVRHFTGHTSIGWSSMFVSIWAIGGLQILAIGIIGEYIGKIYMETKERPKFIIEKELD